MTDNRLTAEELDALEALYQSTKAKVSPSMSAEQRGAFRANLRNAIEDAAPALLSSARALAEAEMRVTELEALLEPFAKEGDKWAPHVADDHRPEIGAHGTIAEFTVGDLRRACAARLLTGETK